MYVRTLTFECRSDVGQRDIETVYHELIDVASRRDGFAGSTLMMSEDACRGMAMIFWRDQQAATDASDELVELLGSRIHDLLDHPPDIAGYLVLDDRFVDHEQAVIENRQ